MFTLPRPRRVASLVLSLAVASACSSADDTELFSAPPGRAAFAILGQGQELVEIEYSVTNSSGEVLMAENLRPEPGQAIDFVLALPAGSDYSIALRASTADGSTCIGTSGFDVASRQRVAVNVELACDASAGGQASIIGTLVPAAACPSIEIASAPSELAVGASLVLRSNVQGNVAASPVWTASAGELATAGGVTRFTCTEAGTVSIGLSVSDTGCVPDGVDITCTAAPSTSACDGLGSTCHVVAESSTAAHDCHELGHAGDEAACGASRASCIDTCGTAVCAELSSLCHDVDPGSGPLHECHDLGHAADATACFARGRECFDLCTRAHDEPVTIQFAAQVGDAAFACGNSYAGVGSTGATVEPQDFRFFVHDVRLVTSDGAEVAVELDVRAPWQALGTTLLDFEDATGACLSGDAATNTSITGKAPPGDYTGIAFRVGVPESINHDNPATQPAPLAAGNMAWGWLSGYRFLRAELGTEGGGGVLHLGSAACTGDPAAGSVNCARPDRASVSLTGFDAATGTIIADIGALFAGSDLATATLCHSSGAACGPLFDRLGVSLETGQATGAQSMFRMAP
jgi:uncharacterized repeat protein (TIGR04052 family)